MLHTSPYLLEFKLWLNISSGGLLNYVLPRGFFHSFPPTLPKVNIASLLHVLLTFASSNCSSISAYCESSILSCLNRGSAPLSSHLSLSPFPALTFLSSNYSSLSAFCESALVSCHGRCSSSLLLSPSPTLPFPSSPPSSYLLEFKLQLDIGPLWVCFTLLSGQRLLLCKRFTNRCAFISQEELIVTVANTNLAGGIWQWFVTLVSEKGKITPNIVDELGHITVHFKCQLFIKSLTEKKKEKSTILGWMLL